MKALARHAALAAAPPAIARSPASPAPQADASALAVANAQVARRDWTAARMTLERRLAQAPDGDEARFLLARVRARQGAPEAALPLYAALLAREPDNADCLLGQGLAQLWAGRHEAAIATLERAQRLAPGYADVDRTLAQARAADTPAAAAAPASVTPIDVERDAGAWRAGYTATATRLRGTHAVGHDLRRARAYGDRGEVGVQFATGGGDARLGTQVVASDVRAWSLGGRHPLTADRAPRWSAGHVKQGALYVRDGVALGLERRF